MSEGQPREEQAAFRPAARAHTSVLARVEKKALIWIAERLPRWVNSDHLTLLGFVAMACAGLSYWWARYDRRGLLLVIFWLAVNWFGDSLDGTLARVRKQQRPRYGFYVDHLVDTFCALFLLGGLALSGYMTPLAATGLLIAYYVLAIEVYLATYALGTFHMSFAGVGPTELRILLALGNVWLYAQGTVPVVQVFKQDYLLFDVGGAVAMAGMMCFAVLSAVRHTRVLYLAEPIPRNN